MRARVRHEGAAPSPGLVVGVTGGVAAGKTTVARILASGGGVVLEADRLGHELLAPRRVCWRELKRAFGPGILCPDGTVDRRRLGALVFRREAARRRLNRIVHPRLLRELARAVRRARREAQLVVLDAALLVEWGWRDRVDVLVVVDASRGTRVRRLMDKGYTRREAEDRIRSQVGRRQKMAAADIVVFNQGDLRALGVRVAALRRMLAGGRHGTEVLPKRPLGLKIRPRARAGD